MPTYEYRCRDCGEPLEVVQSFSDDPLDTCPACGGSLRKVFGSVGIAFKGSGFYKTDSRGSAGTKVSSAASADGGAGESSGASSSGDSSSGDSGGSSTAGGSGTGGDSSNGSKSGNGSGGSATPSGATPAKGPKAEKASA